MTDILVGRKHEQRKLQKIFISDESEFVAIYGRRRVGKTFLIRRFFEKKTCILFQVTGIHGASLKEQLKEFRIQIEKTFYAEHQGTKLQTPGNWMDALRMLTDAIKLFGGRQKIVLFFDEIPWMASRKSGLLQALDYYWNHFWTSYNKLKLIVCGSAASWVIKNIVNNKGGLHNRITLRLRIEPFSLHETMLYLKQRKVNLTYQQILHLYLCIGGIPFYLRFIDKKLSAIQNINQLCFKKQGALFDEFRNLFSSLFDHAEAHEQLIKTIALKREGLSRAEIEKNLSTKGGRLTLRLRELEEAGFIAVYLPQGKERASYYKVIDEYTFFYLKWVIPNITKSTSKELTEKHWESISQTPVWKAWSGYAFEMLCHKHVKQIYKALHIPEGSITTSWRHIQTKKTKFEGAQIDLLIERPDDIIQICEIKYCSNPYKIDKDYAKELSRKIEIYRGVTKYEKQIFVSMITSNHLQKTMSSEELVNSEVTLKDLFEDII